MRNRLTQNLVFRSKGFKSILSGLLLINLIFGDFIYKNNYLKANQTNLLDQDYLRQKRNDDFYILGPGDGFSMRIVDSDLVIKTREELNPKDVIIDSSGYINLPRLNRIYVSGLTIEELIKILNKEYELYLNKPDVSILMNQYRPVKVYVDGEVENPGLHVLGGSTAPQNLLSPGMIGILSEDNIVKNRSDLEFKRNSSLPSSIGDNLYFPSVVDVLRSAQGITLIADLSNIEIIRLNSISNGGGKIKTKIDLGNFINMTDQSQNIRVMDGDIIKINRSEEEVLSQISKVIKSNINPRFIQVFLSGRVQRSGRYKVNKSASLTDALLLGGGTLVLKGDVIFVRYNNDGSIDRRKFALNKKAPRGSYKNPYLKNGDLIFIDKNILNRSSEVISEITSPLKGILSSILFLKIIDD